MSDPKPCLSPLIHGDRVLSGLRVRSDFPLPDLLAWTGEDRPVDLRICLASVPQRLEDAVVTQPLLQVAADGRCRFALPQVAAYLVSADGRAVSIDIAEGAAPAAVRTFLYGTVFAVVCHRRGLLPLHACCVRIGDKAVAFAGDSGAGKSTLALGLSERGYALLADDVTAVDTEAPGGPTALPSFPRLKLWRDALARAGLSTDGLEEVRTGQGKYQLSLEHRYCPTPLPLAGLIHLDKDERGPLGLRPVPAREGLGLLSSVLYRPRLLLRLGTQQRQMQQFLRLLGSVGGISAMRRPESPAEWDRIAELLPALAA